MAIAGILGGIGIYAEIQTVEVRLGKIEQVMAAKDVVDMEISTVESGVKEVKEDIKAIKQSQIDADLRAVERTAKLDLILKIVNKK